MPTAGPSLLYVWSFVVVLLIEIGLKKFSDFFLSARFTAMIYLFILLMTALFFISLARAT